MWSVWLGRVNRAHGHCPLSAPPARSVGRADTVLSAFADASLFGERTGEAPLRVLALHGWGRSHKDFERVLAPAGQVPINGISLDLPGFGATPAPDRPFSSMDYARVIAPVLDEAVEPVVVVGHSHGGRVAVCLASMRPEVVKGLVLVAAPVLRRKEGTKPSRRYRMIRAAHRVHLISDERFEAIRRRAGSSDYAAATGVMRDTLVTVVNESFESQLAELHCPVVLVCGSADTDVPLEVAQRARDLIATSANGATASITVLDGIGHLIPTSAPTAVRAAIEGLLA